MRARHLSTVAGLLGAGVLALAGPAFAGSPVVIEPDPVSPGSQFTIFDGGNCDSSGGTATFKSREHQGEDIPAVKLASLRGLMGAVTTIPEHARPGVYEVSIQCTSVTHTEVTATFTVHPGDSKPDTRPDDPSGPKGPTHAGLGGSTGPNLPETLAGATLLTTAAAATVHHLRRRRG